ncbi:MAG: 30S ribosomal protein S12 methylthiotransferase RimO [Desulfobacterales bacterium]
MHLKATEQLREPFDFYRIIHNILYTILMKLHLVSLGCAKNLVDSEVMLGRLMKAGWTNTRDPKEADIIIVNTCSFIESAINESIDTILALAKYKHNGFCHRLIVAGCLPERFREEIITAIPEVDLFMGTGAFDKIVEAVDGSLNAVSCFLPDPNLTGVQQEQVPRINSSSHMAYLKIAEGCSRHCTYCIIPKLRGKQKSRPLEDIITEARYLISSGVKELVLVAQDTTSYGMDLCPSVPLSRLLENLSEISESIWIRLLYGHPESIEDSVIKTISDYPNICSYFDIPIQHSSDGVLKKMGRNYTSESLRRLFDKIRSSVSDAALRTTAIVGFPGETDKDFEDLLSFVNDICFDHLGVFIYSDFRDLISHNLPYHIPKGVAKDRHDTLMSCQLKISLDNNQKHIGRIYDVLVENTTEENLFNGRTFFQAPDVDGITYIHSEQLEIGSFVGVRVAEALEYDLTGEIV